MDWLQFAESYVAAEPDEPRCGWRYEVCDGLVHCGAIDGHSGPWHGCMGENWAHLWHEDDPEAYPPEPDPPVARPQDHYYVSTACHHDRHGECRYVCKFCGAECMCICTHTGGVQASEHVWTRDLPPRG